MQSANHRNDEAQSLEALRALDVLDSDPEAEFDALVRAASIACGVPIALISLIDANRQWFKAHVGLPGLTETSRDVSFCAHAVLGDEVFEVSDATLDPRFADNPLVTGDPGVRFYAGAPIRLGHGHRVGTLCIIDRLPRALTQAQREILQCLSVAASHALEARRASRLFRVATLENEGRLRRLYEATPAMLHSIGPDGRILAVSDLWLTQLGYTRQEVMGRLSIEFLSPASQAFARDVVLPDFFKTGRCDEVSYQMLTRDGQVMDVLFSATLERDAQGQTLRSVAVMQDVTLRRRAERDLFDERQRLANIVDGANVGTWEWHVGTGGLRINPRFAQLVGRVIDAAAPATIAAWAVHIHPDDRLHSEALLKEHFEGRTEHYACELRLLHADGHWVWALDRGRVITRDADGRPVLMMGTRWDISDRKHQETALRTSEAFLDRTGQLAGVGGWQLDVGTGALVWSAETRRIHGVAADFQPTLEDAIHFYAPEAQPVIQAAVERAIAVGEPWDLELPLIRHDGRRIWARAQGAVDRSAGAAVRLVGAFQDITHRKDLELQLKAASAQVLDLYDNAPCGYHSLDADGVFLHINATALTWLGCTREEVVGRKRASEFFTSEGQVQFRRNFSRLLSQGRVDGLEFELVPKIGAGRRVSLTATAVQDANGRFLMTRTVMFDITELRRVERHAQELDRLLAERSEMLDVLAHEVRQPLNNASAALQSAIAVLAERGERAASEQMRRVQVVLGTVMSGIDNTLAVASLLAGAGDGETTLADTDIDLLIGVCVGDMPASARGRIRVERQTPTRTLWADAGLMRLALRNLLANALEFSPGDTDVTIRICESDAPFALMIDVVDQGSGIDPAVLPRLFERGVRSSAMGHRLSHGLGLYIVRRALQLHGGDAVLLHTGPTGTAVRLQLFESTKALDC